MNPTPYLVFKGNCRDAIQVYADVFGGKVTMLMTGADMPEMEVSPDKADWIMHSEITFDGGSIMASDDMMGSNPAMAGSWVMMELGSNAEAKTAFEAMCEGGEVVMPYSPTPWSEGFGMVNDRFGTRWMISAPGPAG